MDKKPCCAAASYAKIHSGERVRESLIRIDALETEITRAQGNLLSKQAQLHQHIERETSSCEKIQKSINRLRGEKAKLTRDAAMEITAFLSLAE